MINETGSLLDEADISYDKTEEDLDDISYLRNGKAYGHKGYKRPSAPPMEDDDTTPPGKKTKKERRSTRVLVNSHLNPKLFCCVKIHRKSIYVIKSSTYQRSTPLFKSQNQQQNKT